MQENKVRRLPVINQHRKLVGILSIGDIALGTGDTKLVGVAIQKVSMPDAPKPLPGQKRE
jgi:CBS domain-containing protein